MEKYEKYTVFMIGRLNVNLSVLPKLFCNSAISIKNPSDNLFSNWQTDSKRHTEM